MTSIDIYTILSSKPHNPHYLKRYHRFITYCLDSNAILSNDTYTEIHHICPKAKDLFPEYTNLKTYSWNSIKLTARQHIVAHVILWKCYGGSQTQSLDYILNRFNSSSNQYSLSNRIIPTSISIRYSAQIKEETRIMSLGMSTYKDSEGNKYYIHKSDPKIQELNLVGNNSGHKMNAESRHNMSKSKDHTRTIRLYLLDKVQTVRIQSEEYSELLELGWHSKRTQTDYDYIKSIANEKVSSKMKGKFTYYYPDGITKYGYICVDDPIISELGLIVPYTDAKRKQNVERSKLASIANSGTIVYNNGIIAKKFREYPGDDWVKGGLPRKKRNK